MSNLDLSTERKLQCLRKVKELLKDEKNWIKNDMAEDANHEPVSTRSQDAKCFCLMGASRRSVFDVLGIFNISTISEYAEHIDHELFQTITELYPDNKGNFYDWIDDFNDHEETEFSHIHKVIDATIERLEGQG